MLGSLGNQVWDYYSCQPGKHELTLYYGSFRSTCILIGHSNTIPKGWVIVPFLNVVPGKEVYDKVLFVCVVWHFVLQTTKKPFRYPISNRIWVALATVVIVRSWNAQSVCQPLTINYLTSSSIHSSILFCVQSTLVHVFIQTTVALTKQFIRNKCYCQ